MLMIPNVGRTFDESSTTTDLSTLFSSLYLYPCDPIIYIMHRHTYVPNTCVFQIHCFTNEQTSRSNSPYSNLFALH